LKVTVLDTGIGIDEKKQQSLFKIFGDGLRAQKNKNCGVGFALDLCY